MTNENNPADGQTVQAIVDVLNDQGLHARPAARLAREAQRFSAQLTLFMDDMVVDAKSILDILTLAAAKGSSLTITGVGVDAEPAVMTLAELFHNRFKD
ncbi:MAG: HPr family phosphocarrier protein [Pseudomonadota bacterium]